MAGLGSLKKHSPFSRVTAKRNHRGLRKEHYEQNPNLGRHIERRVHPDRRRPAPELGIQRAALRGLGDVSPQRLEATLRKAWRKWNAWQKPGS